MQVERESVSLEFDEGGVIAYCFHFFVFLEFVLRLSPFPRSGKGGDLARQLHVPRTFLDNIQKLFR